MQTKEYKQDYYLKNKEKIRQKAAEYYKTHWSEMRASNKLWIAEHKDQVIAYKKKHYQDNKRKYQNSRRKSTFGITQDEYENLFLAQKGMCAICSMALPVGRGTHLDHCHRTGKIREFLCTNCNTGIGKFKDNCDFLLSAIRYITKHNGG